jgi:hypothetical protein
MKTKRQLLLLLVGLIGLRVFAGGSVATSPPVTPPSYPGYVDISDSKFSTTDCIFRQYSNGTLLYQYTAATVRTGITFYYKGAADTAGICTSASPNGYTWQPQTASLYATYSFSQGTTNVVYSANNVREASIFDMYVGSMTYRDYYRFSHSFTGDPRSWVGKKIR